MRDRLADAADLGKHRVLVRRQDLLRILGMQKELITAIGVGSDTWKRTPAGMSPSLRVRKS